MNLTPADVEMDPVEMSALLPDITMLQNGGKNGFAEPANGQQDLVCRNSLGSCTIKEDILVGGHPAAIPPDECDEPVCRDIVLTCSFIRGADTHCFLVT